MTAGHQSLDIQIQQAQMALSERHVRVGERTSRVAVLLKQRITSPIALAAAFGGGFILDRMIRLIPRRTKSSGQPGTQQKPGLIGRIMEIVALGPTLLTAWPGALLRRFISLVNAWTPTRPAPPSSSEYMTPPHIYP